MSDNDLKVAGRFATEQMIDDDDDIYRIKMYAQANALSGELSVCTDEVKMSLFQSATFYCSLTVKLQTKKLMETWSNL